MPDRLNNVKEFVVLGSQPMIQIVVATVENRVIKPDTPVALPSMTRVRLSFEPLTLSDEEAAPGQGAAWAEVDRIWEDLDINSGGPPPKRDEFYDRG